MRLEVIVFILATMLAGCMHLDTQKNMAALDRVRVGDSQESVFQLVGMPDLRHDITDRRWVAFYQTRPVQTSAGKASDAPLTTAWCTPVSFEDGRVVSVGEDLTESWTRDENERLRQAKILDQRRQQAALAETARQRAAAERRKKIERLENEVGPVPASNAALNLKLYRELLDLDPDNPRYQDKVALYEERLAVQVKARQEQARLAAKEKRRLAWEHSREKRNQSLRQYSGNGIAEMAVHDMGNGSLYVWVKNVSQRIITTHPDYFTLLNQDDRPVVCVISDSLDRVLEPGSISHGKIDYRAEVQPKALIFENRESGRVVKFFQ